MGSPLTNKYAEGLPGKRYYGGCEVVDQVEQLAIDRAKQLFGADHANVQPHSGAQANYAAMSAVPQAGRHVPRHGSVERRASHARLAGEFLGHAVSRRLVRRHRRRAASTTTTCVARRASIAPKLVLAGYSAYSRVDRLRRVRRGREGDRRDLHGGHGALRRARRGRRVSVAGPARRRRHDDDAQDAARSARRADPLQGRAREGDRQGGVSRQPGRPARARHRREGGVLQGSARSVVQDVRAAASSPTRARSRRRSRRAASRSCRAGPTTT